MVLLRRGIHHPQGRADSYEDENKEPHVTVAIFLLLLFTQKRNDLSVSIGNLA